MTRSQLPPLEGDGPNVSRWERKRPTTLTRVTPVELTACPYCDYELLPAGKLACGPDCEATPRCTESYQQRGRGALCELSLGHPPDTYHRWRIYEWLDAEQVTGTDGRGDPITREAARASADASKTDERAAYLARGERDQELRKRETPRAEEEVARERLA